MPSRNPYGCVFCPTYLLAFFFLAGVFFLAFLAGAFFARGFFSSFASAFGAGAGATGAAPPATRLSTWLVRFRIDVPRLMAAAVNGFSVWRHLLPQQALRSPQ